MTTRMPWRGTVEIVPGVVHDGVAIQQLCLLGAGPRRLATRVWMEGIARPTLPGNPSIIFLRIVYNNCQWWVRFQPSCLCNSVVCWVKFVWLG